MSETATSTVKLSVTSFAGTWTVVFEYASGVRHHLGNFASEAIAKEYVQRLLKMNNQRTFDERDKAALLRGAIRAALEMLGDPPGPVECGGKHDVGHACAILRDVIGENEMSTPYDPNELDRHIELLRAQVKLLRAALQSWVDVFDKMSLEPDDPAEIIRQQYHGKRIAQARAALEATK